jgi:putative transposase
LARVVVPGEPHHITQRGNNRQDVFFTDADRRVYLETLKDRAGRYGVKILAYCLVNNHVHLVAVPRSADSLSKGIGGTHVQYARYVNRLYGRSGHFWQDRFFSIPMDDKHTVFAVRYVERNPVRAKMVRVAWRYRWSSAAAHCGEKDPSALLDTRGWARRFPPEIWAELLRDAEDPEMVEALRRRTMTGRPLGSDRFIAKLEARLGMRLRANPVGRPRKKKGSGKGRGGRGAR